MILFIMALLSSSNVGGIVSVNGQDIQTNLTLARTKFQDTFNGKDNNNIMYGFGYSRICFCFPESILGPNWVVVEENTIKEITNRFGEPLKEDISNTILTIDGVFDLIQDAIDTNAVSIDVTFDEMYGYPADVVIDYDDMIADEEYYLTIDAFSPYSAWLDDYNTHKQTWENNMKVMATADGSTSDNGGGSRMAYEYTYTRICFCQEEFLGPFNVKVDENGVVTEVTNIGDHEKNMVVDTTGNTMWNVPTITEVFETIENALLPSDGELPAFSLDVVYDKKYGFPQDIYIDFDERIADEEFGAIISNVKLIVPDDSTATSTSTTIVDEGTTDGEGGSTDGDGNDTPAASSSDTETDEPSLVSTDSNDLTAAVNDGSFSLLSSKSLLFVSNVTLLVVSLMVSLVE